MPDALPESVTYAELLELVGTARSGDAPPNVRIDTVDGDLFASTVYPLDVEDDFGQARIRAAASMTAHSRHVDYSAFATAEIVEEDDEIRVQVQLSTDAQAPYRHILADPALSAMVAAVRVGAL